MNIENLQKKVLRDLEDEAASAESYLEQLIASAERDLKALREGVRMRTSMTGVSYLRDNAAQAAEHIEALNRAVSLAINLEIDPETVRAAATRKA